MKMQNEKTMEGEDEIYVFCLQISQGVGLKNRNKSVVIVASLSGNTIESGILEVNENSGSSYFNVQLIWETDKKSLKKVKTENQQIKIECYALELKNEHEVRSLIGYMLLPIRGVPINTHKKMFQAKPHWHKLIGLSGEWRAKKPELYLYLTIATKQQFSQGNYIKAPNELQTTASMLRSQKGIYIKLLQEEGLLQVGDSSDDSDIFIVKILFKQAAHLEQIINSEERKNKSLRLQYNLLGTPTFFSLTPKDDGIYIIQEKVAIHFRSSLRSLREYFDKVLYIPIDLYNKTRVIGHSVFRFENFITTDDLATFESLYGSNNNTQEKEGVIYIEPLFDLPPTVTSPYVEYIFTLYYMATAKIQSCEIIVDKPQIAEYIDNLAGGDTAASTNRQNGRLLEILPLTNYQFMYNNNNGAKCVSSCRETDDTTKNDTRSVYSDSVLYTSNYYFEKCSRTNNNDIINDNKPAANTTYDYNDDIKSPIKTIRSDLMPDNNEICNETDYEDTDKIDINALIAKKSSRKIKNVPRTFSYNLILESVKFTRRPEIGIWQISLHHPKAETPFTIVNAELTKIASNFIVFKDIELQLFFASAPNNVLNIVESESCILKIFGPRGMQAFAELDNEILLMNTKEKKSGVIFMEDDNGNKVAMAHIFVYLEDVGLNFNSQLKTFNKNYITRTISNENNDGNQKIYFDENLAYKVVEELEDWKRKQQEEFLIELKRKEINHLAQLTAEWKKRKFEQEIKLEDKLEQCTKLTDALEEAYNLVKEKGYAQLEQTKIIEQTKAEMEKMYSNKIIELNEKIRRLENDTEHQIKLEQLKYMELEMIKNHLETDNTKLLKDNDELKSKIIEMQKTYLPREQLAGLFQDVRILSERLEEVQKSKDFYKDQWAKIIREVHNMKSEELKKMELHLKRTASLGLQEFLKDEQTELSSEMNELNFVKSVLNNPDNLILPDSKEDVQQ